MRELQAAALNELQRLGAEYGDVRVTTTRTQLLSVKNGEVEAADSAEDSGFGVRALFAGAWGFACSNNIDLNEAIKVARTAVNSLTS